MSTKGFTEFPRLQRTCSCVALEALLHPMPAQNQDCQEGLRIPTLNRPASPWPLPAAWAGWVWGWLQAAVHVMVWPQSKGSYGISRNLPWDEAHCPASSTPKPADSPVPLEIHWWPKQNAISVGPYWVKVIPNDLKFFKHCFFILNFQIDKGIRKMMWYFKWSESADRTYEELFLFWTSDIWLAPANGAESIRYANMDTQNLHFHCHVSIHSLGNHILVTS